MKMIGTVQNNILSIKDHSMCTVPFSILDLNNLQILFQQDLLPPLQL